MSGLPQDARMLAGCSMICSRSLFWRFLDSDTHPSAEDACNFATAERLVRREVGCRNFEKLRQNALSTERRWSIVSSVSVVLGWCPFNYDLCNLCCVLSQFCLEVVAGPGTSAQSLFGADETFLERGLSNWDRSCWVAHGVSLVRGCD